MGYQIHLLLGASRRLVLMLVVGGLAVLLTIGLRRRLAIGYYRPRQLREEVGCRL